VMRRRWRWRCRNYWRWLDQLLLCWRLFMMLFVMTMMMMLMTRSRDTIGAIWRWECFWCVGGGGGVGNTGRCG
jgi:hypothetical protein